MTNEGSGDVADVTQREFARGQKVFGRYTLIKILGRGGMGVVWPARDEELEREVALKFLPDLIVHDRALLDELKRETRRSLELTHKNIVRIHDFVFNETSGCISMEYVDGDTLSNLRLEKEQKVFEPHEIATLTSQLCDALDYAHNQARIVHRDLKPANLMVNQKGDLKISDFGIARSLGDSITRLTMEAATSSGTLVYMSPQQLDGERSTHLDDVYSLGATLYDLLTSKPPFYSGNLDRQIHERVAPSVSERRKDLNIEPASVPPIWEEVVAACLKKDPAQRPQSTAEVANRLQLAAPTVAWARTISLARPKTKTLAVAGIALLVIVAMGGWYFGRSKFYAKPAAAVTNVISQAAALVEKSIAVLPFESFSDDKENAYLADGVQDDILTDLAKVADLKVISRRSVAQYRDTKKSIREIGQALGVAHVLEGSVRKAAGKIHVTAQLIDTRTETQTWAEKYDRDIADVFAIQSEISQTIVTQLKAALSPTEKAAIDTAATRDMQAYDLYLRGKELVFNAVSSKNADAEIAKAIDLLNQAVARDRGFALAYALLSQVHVHRFRFGAAAEHDLEKAQVYAETALRLGPELGEAHLAKARYLYEGLRDYQPALAEFTVARQTLPNNADVLSWTGILERRMGRWAEAVRDQQKAMELDPHNPATLDLIVTFRLLRNYPEAERTIDRALIALPQLDNVFRTLKARIALARGDMKACRALLQSLPPDYQQGGFVPYLWGQVAVYERNWAEAARILAQVPLDKPYAKKWVARDQALLARAEGDPTKAQAAFQAAFDLWAADKEEDPMQRLSMVAIFEAGLGHKDDALRDSQRAVDLFPKGGDATDGPTFLRAQALVFAWCGERERALTQLAALAKHPGEPPPGELKFDPAWDDLRGDPRFAEIIAAVSVPVKPD